MNGAGRRGPAAAAGNRGAGIAAGEVAAGEVAAGRNGAGEIAGKSREAHRRDAASALRRIGFGALCSGLLAACATAPYTGRTQLITVSAAEEVRLGEAAFEDAKSGAVLVDDSRALLVRRVGERIAAASGRSDYRWEFILTASDEVNAFALPGGKVVFHSGILPYCAGEDGVAAVMAHEVAHVLARHGAERLSQARLLDFGGAAVSAVFSGGSPAVRKGVAGAYGMGGKVGVLLPFSRKHEGEADEMGLVLMAKAGFDPATARDFWRRLLEGQKGGRASEILSSHPSGEDRLRRIEELLPIAREYYRKAIAGAPPPKGGLERAPEASPDDIIRRLRESGSID